MSSGEDLLGGSSSGGQARNPARFGATAPLTTSRYFTTALKGALTRVCSSEHAAERAGNDIPNTIARIMGLDAAVLIGYDTVRGRLIPLGFSGVEAAVGSLLTEDSARWIALRSIKENRIQLVSAAHQNPFVPRSLVQAVSSTSLSISVVPIQEEGNPVGALVLFSVSGDAFTNAALQGLGQALGVCADTVRQLIGRERADLGALTSEAPAEEEEPSSPPEPNVERLHEELAHARAEIQRLNDERRTLVANRRQIEFLRHENEVLQKHLEVARSSLTARVQLVETTAQERLKVAQQAHERTQQALEEALLRIEALEEERAPAATTTEQTAEATEADVEDEVELDEELRDAFLVEYGELMDACEQVLLALEREPQSRELQEELMRQLHTLKGALSSMGLNRAARQVHAGESLLQEAGEGALSIDAGAVDLLFRLSDSVTGLVESGLGMSEPSRPIISNIDAEIAHLKSGEGETSVGGAGLAGEGDLRSAEGANRTVRVDASRLDTLAAKLNQLSSGRSRLIDELQTLINLRDRLQELRTRAAQQQSALQRSVDQGSAEGIDTFISLAVETGQMGESLSNLIEMLNDEASEFYELSSGLETEMEGLRMVPLETVYRRLQRPVRDAARQTEKMIDLVMRGGDLPVERQVAEALYAPLLHLLRNAVSHGIEPPELRERRNKPRTGTIRVEAAEHMGDLQILVQDDGAGVNLDAVMARAVERKLINPAYEPGRDQLLALIFRPGFSTASTVSDLAGRGVGMDVVSQQVKALGGFVRLDTDDGLGTTVEIVLPRRVMDPKKEGEETAGSGEERTAPQELATPREHEGG